ncbi:MAG: HEAT repeat domain-containing protein [Allosphingosinicella sp.]
MIPGAALGQWLADRDAQNRSVELVDASARKWSAQPLISQLERELVENPDYTPEQLIDAARRFMDRTSEVDGLMRDLIASSRNDPYFRPPFHPLSSEVHNSLLLYHHPSLSISLGVTGVEMLAAKKTGRRGRASINFTGYVTLLRFLKAGNATLSFWEADPIDDNFSAAQAGACRLVERRRIRDGEEFVIDVRRRSYVIEHAEDDILFFQAVARAGCAPVGVEYDSDTLQCIGATSTDEASSRLQMMVSLLRSMEREDAFPLFEQALASPLFYTRWHVMREMLAMDADAARPALQLMAEADPHPDVRAAAQQTLDLFFADDGAADDALQGETACRA